jgi:Ca-activated chloride channel family protein
MASTIRSVPGEQRISDWLRPHLTWITAPSWLMSVGFHAGLLFLLVLLSRSQGCQRDYAGDGGDSFTQVGIHVLQPGVDPALTEAAQSADDSALPEDVPFPSEVLNSAALVDAVPQQPPVPLSLPALPGPPVLGAGGAPPVSSTAVESLLQPSRSSAAPRPSQGAPQATSLFGATDTGGTYVYVIDRSWSMDGDGRSRGPTPLNVAKDELAASIQRLSESQQFQIIFYNSDDLVVLNNDAGRSEYFWGTDTQRLSAVRQFRLVQASGGTDHMPALRKALGFNPDVIFFLTDGQEPPLTTRDLQAVRRLNRGTRIHCIEFGEGSRTASPGGIDPGNWVQKLALENDGTYVYRDVRQFGR